jgi:pimeloyl-ACP methyl ester carboxylesterase
LILDKFKLISVVANGHNFEVLEAGEGDRLALCLHGFPEHAIAWHSQVDCLVELGYRVWAPNQRGYGNSYRPQNVDDYKISILIEDIAALIDAASAKSVTLLGHDWGGVIAWFFAARKKRPLERLVIINAPHPATFAQHFFGRQMFRSWYVYYFIIPVIPELLLSRNNGKRLRKLYRRTAKHPENITEEEMNLYTKNVSTPERARALLNWYRANCTLNALREMRIGMTKIDVPTLLIWGEDDIALCKETTFGTAKFVRNLHVRYLKGVSHWVQQDEPEMVNELIQAFLTDRDVPEYD